MLKKNAASNIKGVVGKMGSITPRLPAARDNIPKVKYIFFIKDNNWYLKPASPTNSNFYIQETNSIPVLFSNKWEIKVFRIIYKGNYCPQTRGQ